MAMKMRFISIGSTHPQGPLSRLMTRCVCVCHQQEPNDEMNASQGQCELRKMLISVKLPFWHHFNGPRYFVSSKCFDPVDILAPAFGYRRRSTFLTLGVFIGRDDNLMRSMALVLWDVSIKGEWRRGRNGRWVWMLLRWIRGFDVAEMDEDSTGGHTAGDRVWNSGIDFIPQSSYRLWGEFPLEVMDVQHVEAIVLRWIIMCIEIHLKGVNSYDVIISAPSHTTINIWPRFSFDSY